MKYWSPGQDPTLKKNNTKLTKLRSGWGRSLPKRADTTESNTSPSLAIHAFFFGSRSQWWRRGFNLHMFSNCLCSTSIWCMDLKSQYLWHHVVFWIPMNIYESSESSSDFHFPLSCIQSSLQALGRWKKSAGNRKGSQWLEQVPLVFCSLSLLCDPPTT